MPLSPGRLKDLNQQFDTLTKRFDAFIERRKADQEDDDDDDDEDENELVDPAEEAMNATPGSDLATLEFEEPWY